MKWYYILCMQQCSSLRSFCDSKYVGNGTKIMDGSWFGLTISILQAVIFYLPAQTPTGVC